MIEKIFPRKVRRKNRNHYADRAIIHFRRIENCFEKIREEPNRNSRHIPPKRGDKNCSARVQVQRQVENFHD